MSLDNFIPEIWAAEVMRSLEKSLIFGQAGIVNRDYEGEIKQKGDTVRINEIGPVTVKKYTKNTAIDHPEVLNDAQQVLEITEQDYDRVLDVNLKGSFFMLQACAREMVKQVAAGKPPGAIINMSSVNDTLAIPTIVSYCIAKGGVSQLTRATSISLAPHGIRVNAIGPGSIMTGMLHSVVSDKAAMARVMSRTPMGRVGEPSEIAAIAVFLASDDSSYVTGQTIYADGGRMPLNYTVPVKE